MPLLHMDNVHRGGGSTDGRRRSFMDTGHFTDPPPSSSTTTSYQNGGEDSDWGWRSPCSPQAATTPRSYVPPACFPPRHTSEYASFSESARPGGGGGWNDDTHSSGGSRAPSAAAVAGLVAEMKTLSTAPRAVVNKRHSLHTNCDTPYDNPPSTNSYYARLEVWNNNTSNANNGNGNNGNGNDMDYNGNQHREESRNPYMSRRASFCGVVTGDENGSTVNWSGTLPMHDIDPDETLSSKVFVGGLPWDVTDQALMQALMYYQPVRVEWPGGGAAPRGFAYVTFESERHVRALMADCRTEDKHYYYRMACRNFKNKEVQVIPWPVSSGSWSRSSSAGGGPGFASRLVPSRTVFVGALHGCLSAQHLALIMDDLFGGVVYAGIDMDKNKYPIGSGRVSFDNARSYVRAVSARHVAVRAQHGGGAGAARHGGPTARHVRVVKRLQVDPYLEDSMCSQCHLQQGPYFCRDPMCYRYFCRSCWAWSHAGKQHAPLMRGARGGGGGRRGTSAQGDHSPRSNTDGNPSPPILGPVELEPLQEPPDPSLVWSQA